MKDGMKKSDDAGVTPIRIVVADDHPGRWVLPAGAALHHFRPHRRRGEGLGENGPSALGRPRLSVTRAYARRALPRTRQ